MTAMPITAATSTRASSPPPNTAVSSESRASSPATRAIAPRKDPSRRSPSGIARLHGPRAHPQVGDQEDRQRAHQQHCDRGAERVVLLLEERPADDVAHQVDLAAAEDLRDDVLAHHRDED